MELQERFENKISKSQHYGCWMWTAHLSNRGYGQFWVEGKFQLAHRMSYRIYVGEIPSKMCVLHKCDTPACVNPDHLFLGTHKDNMDDRDAKGRARGRFSKPKFEEM